jgi:hypothetical protein
LDERHERAAIRSSGATARGARFRALPACEPAAWRRVGAKLTEYLHAQVLRPMCRKSATPTPSLSLDRVRGAPYGVDDHDRGLSSDNSHQLSQRKGNIVLRIDARTHAGRFHARRRCSWWTSTRERESSTFDRLEA